MTTLKVTRDDYDWLLELGREQGQSRIMDSLHESAQKLVRQFRPPIADALTLPWLEARDAVRFMPGKVSVWSGPTFSGKTAFLRQLMLHAIANGHRVLFMSLEEEPDDVWREFMCTASLTRSPTPHQRQYCLDVWENKLFVLDSTEMIEPDLAMGIVRHAADKLGVTHVVIDSLMRLSIRTDDYEGQRAMGNMLGRVARKSGAHIHLVAHPRKTANSRDSMDLYDIRGAQDIVAQADLVLTLERKRVDGAPDHNVLTLWKQRGDTNWIGAIQCYYHAASRQLLYRSYDEPTRYLPADAFEDSPRDYGAFA